VPRESGFDQCDADVAPVKQEAGYQAPVLVNVSNIYIDCSTKNQFAGELLGPITEVLTAFGEVDPLKTYANLFAVAKDANRVAVDDRDDSARELLRTDHADDRADNEDAYAESRNRTDAQVHRTLRVGRGVGSWRVLLRRGGVGGAVFRDSVPRGQQQISERGAEFVAALKRQVL
jgi:hypothetical protein